MPQLKVFFGGTFDPVHNGHLIVARAIAERMGLERITLVPAGRSPHKTGAHATAADRLEMLRLATAGEGVFEISQAEISRPGPSYTIQTIRRLRREHGPEAQLAWVIGADMLEDLPKWREINKLLQMARLVVAVRPPWHLRLDQLFGGLGEALGVEAANGLRRSVIPTPTLEISSSDIRERIAQGRSIRYLVSDAVAGYIRRRGLYAAG